MLSVYYVLLFCGFVHSCAVCALSVGEFSRVGILLKLSFVCLILLWFTRRA